jgi:hypothetical protein
MLRDLNLWEEDDIMVKADDNTSATTNETPKDEHVAFGKPKTAVGLYVLQKNIKPTTSSDRIQKCKNGQDGWTTLCMKNKPFRLNLMHYKILKNTPLESMATSGQAITTMNN